MGCFRQNIFGTYDRHRPLGYALDFEGGDYRWLNVSVGHDTNIAMAEMTKIVRKVIHSTLTAICAYP